MACENGPEMLMPLIWRGILPELVKVSVCVPLRVCTGWLPKGSDAGETPAIAAPPWPVKLEDSVPLLPLTESEPVRKPPSEGLKLTWTTQLAAVARTDEQLFVWLKSPVVKTDCVVTQP